MKKLCSIIVLSCLMIMLFLGQAMAAKPQPVLVDNFDNDNNWKPTSSEGLNTVVSTPQLIDGRLIITLPGDASSPYSDYCSFSSGVQSIFQLQGDFDVQVDYELLPDASGIIPQSTGVYVGLCVPSGNVSRASLDYGEVYFSQFTASTYGWVKTSDTKGTLRLTRTTKRGQTLIQGWFLLPNGKWQPMLSGSDTSNINISLSAWSFNPGFIHQDVSVAFDNFVVNSGKLIP